MDNFNEETPGWLMYPVFHGVLHFSQVNLWPFRDCFKGLKMSQMERYQSCKEAVAESPIEIFQEDGSDKHPFLSSSDSLTDAWTPTVHKLCHNQAFCGLCDTQFLSLRTVQQLFRMW
ncbi:hypothetical protein CDAR_255571 [Caerostris darwini]|uniref:Uncharacterized protein n=1 Tax=Caerostris darwini TaxID=1538125 RepID=A0AAV4VDW5_9ARAC|nr:hypothetical protein CDAR_255571 [Caerostris darwini]